MLIALIILKMKFTKIIKILSAFGLAKYVAKYEHYWHILFFTGFACWWIMRNMGKIYCTNDDVEYRPLDKKDQWKFFLKLVVRRRVSHWALLLKLIQGLEVSIFFNGYRLFPADYISSTVQLLHFRLCSICDLSIDR